HSKNSRIPIIILTASNDEKIGIDGVNKGAEQVYGYLAEEALGKNITILESDNLKGEIEQLGEMVKQVKKVQHYETTNLKKMLP
ncbi:MAG: hypothetical protein QG646_3313, partial [Euryarchaeota archaeon]|nr:hypothetical protein [Euryarchaeota archaeon]